jgi:hypothetical protein
MVAKCARRTPAVTIGSEAQMMAVVERQVRSGPLVAIGVVIVIMSVGLLVYAVYTGVPLRYADERQYLEIATNLRNGRGFELDGLPTAYRPPVWPAVLAVFLTLGLPVSLLPVVPALSMIAAAATGAALGVKLTRTSWGALVGVAVLAYPLNIYTAVTLYPQALATLLVVALWFISVMIIDRERERRSAVLYLLLGLAASLLALSVPTMAFTGGAAVVAVVIVLRGDRFRAAAYAGSALLVPIAAWTVRNILVLGAPVPLSTSTGVNLLIGNNPTATGSSGVDVDISGPLDSAYPLSEVKRDAFLRSTAVDWIKDHPLDSVMLYIAKVANYFAPYNEPVTVSGGESTQRLIAYLSFAVLLLFLLARLLVRRRLPFGYTEWVFLGLFVANAFVMAVFFTRTRFRQPLDNILLVEAAIALAVVIGHVLARRNCPGTATTDADSPLEEL